MHPELCNRLVQAQLEEALAAEGLFDERVQLLERELPLFYVRFLNKDAGQRVIRFDCANYDFQPIAIDPVSPETKADLPQSEWMKFHGGNFPNHHMKGGGQFLCIQGTRDYYTHEGHRPQVTGERWEKWRGELTIKDLVSVIKSKFVSGDWS